MTLRSPQFLQGKRYFAASALTLLVLGSAPGVLRAEEVSTEEWNISADKITRYEDPQSVVAEGNIILEKREKIPPPPPATETPEGMTDWSELLGEAPQQKKEMTAEEAEAAPVAAHSFEIAPGAELVDALDQM